MNKTMMIKRNLYLMVLGAAGHAVGKKAHIDKDTSFF